MAINRVTKNISITPEQNEFVEQLVTEGKYQSSSEVFRHGVRLIQREAAADTALKQAQLDEIRTRIQESFDALEKGDY